MIRLIAFSGTIAMFAAASLLVATFSNAGRVEAAEDKAQCQVVHVPADEGYGVSGAVAQRVCD